MNTFNTGRTRGWHVAMLLIAAIGAAAGAQTTLPAEPQPLLLREAEQLVDDQSRTSWRVEVDELVSGGKYLRWTGEDLYQQPADEPPLSVSFDAPADGVYQLQLLSNHGEADRRDLENDVWVRVNKGPWLKLFHDGAQHTQGWTWHSQLDLHHLNQTRPQARYQMEAGPNIIELAGRSARFRFDQLRVLPSDQPATEPKDAH